MKQPKFDRVDGQFVAKTCHIPRRHQFVFKRQGWKFDFRRKAWWTADEDKALPVKDWAVGNAKIHLENAAAIRQAAVDASWAEDTDAEFPAPEGLSYLPFQRAGIEYCLEGERTLIADPPGLGKTIQAIGVHNVLNHRKVLIICPASLKRNWQREWERWDVHALTTGIAHSLQKREARTDSRGERIRDHDGKLIYRTWTEHAWPSTDVVIVNYDMLETFDSQIKNHKWDLVICDEAHLLKTATALRTMCVFGGTKKGNRRKGIEKKEFTPLEAQYHLYLTGTPILSRPIEIWNLIRACDPDGLGKNKERFQYEFCGAYYDAVGFHDDGATNLDKLNRRMRERFMVRRSKKAVLKELPDKIREPVLLPKDKLEQPVKKEHTRAEKALQSYEALLGIDTSDVFRYIDEIGEKLSAAIASQDSEEPDWDAAVKTLSAPERIMFTEISSAREEVALAKVGLVVEHVEKLLISEEPVILFAYHKSVVSSIKDRLEKKGYRVGIVTGDVPSHKRQDVVDAFQDGELDVILGNIIAMGVGYTLTRARFVVFAELDWVPALIEQAEDRAWRHGQKNMVVVQHLIVDGSIEARMAIALLEKMGVISEALD